MSKSKPLYILCLDNGHFFSFTFTTKNTEHDRSKTVEIQMAEERHRHQQGFFQLHTEVYLTTLTTNFD